MSAPDDAVGAGLAALSSFFIGNGTMGDALTRVGDLACQSLGADMAGITILVEGVASTVAFTDPEIAVIDQGQYQSEHGPCLDAFRHSAIYRIDSTDEDGRWPEFARAARAHGVQSTISLPLMTRGEGIGALNLYSRRPHAFRGTDPERSQAFADQAAILLANAKIYWDSRELNENLQQAMQSRSTIDQAIGVIMASGGQTPEDAFGVLVRASQRENRKLRDIARSVVEKAQGRTTSTEGG